MKRLSPLLLLLPSLALAAKASFDHSLSLDPLRVPAAHHGEKMRLSRFLVATPEVRDLGNRVMNRCVDGEDVRTELPLELAVVELRLESLSFAGERLMSFEQGRIPEGERAVVDALDVAIQPYRTHSTWLEEVGCVPWGAGGPWVLLAVDERVPAATSHRVVDTLQRAGFRNVAVLVDDGSPAPELPQEKPPRRPVELTLLQTTESWALVVPDAPSALGSLEDIAIGLRSQQWSKLPDRMILVMGDGASTGEMVHVHDTLIGAGVPWVVPARVGNEKVVWPEITDTAPATTPTWAIDPDGVVPVLLMQLPESGLTIARPRIGPLVTPERMVILGPLRQNQVKLSLERALPTARTCYAEHLAKTPGTEGVVVLKWEVMPDGSVDDTAVIRSDLGAPKVETCLVKALSEGTFSVQAETSIIEAEFHFEL